MTPERTRIGSDAPWEAEVGYSRALRIGDRVLVAGTTAVDRDGRVVGEGDPYRQTREILSRIERALSRAGARLEDVVRTRIYVTDVSRWRDVGRAHGEVFRDVRPAATLVEVRRLIDPAMLVEIEAEAVIGGASEGRCSPR